MFRAASLAVLVLLSGAASRQGGGWEEVAWPFPRDAWPAGRAFRAGGLEVFVRPKLGFCNCTAGVTGDAEVDAVGDVDLLSPDFTAPTEGESVRIAGLAGRARSYVVATPSGKFVAAGYALSSKCDLLVAMARGTGAGDHQRVAELLESGLVAPWIAAKFGLTPTRLTSR